MLYIGSQSESQYANLKHGYGIAFGGGGFAVSAPLAAALRASMDACIARYPELETSDMWVGACAAELGVSMTSERGFHQVDHRHRLRGSAFFGLFFLRLKARTLNPKDSNDRETLSYFRLISGHGKGSASRAACSCSSVAPNQKKFAELVPIEGVWEKRMRSSKRKGCARLTIGCARADGPVRCEWVPGGAARDAGAVAAPPAGEPAGFLGHGPNGRNSTPSHGGASLHRLLLHGRINVSACETCSTLDDADIEELPI